MCWILCWLIRTVVDEADGGGGIIIAVVASGESSEEKFRAVVFDYVKMW